MTDRFLTLSANYIPAGQCWLLISDHRWWNQHDIEIRDWAQSCLDRFEIEGMILKFTSDADRILFLMRWGIGNI
jgi:hypothetical protein